MQSPAPGEEWPCAPGHAMGWEAGKQLSSGGPGVLVDDKLIRSQQCNLKAKKAYRTQGCTRQNVSGSFELYPFPLLSTSESSTIWNAVFCSGLPNTRQTLVNTTKGKEPLSYEKRLRGLGLFVLKKRRLRGFLLICINTWWKALK